MLGIPERASWMVLRVTDWTAQDTKTYSIHSDRLQEILLKSLRKNFLCPFPKELLECQ
jgi:hypothetical protein